MSSLVIWARIEDGSRLEISAASPGSNFSVGARLLIDSDSGTSERQWTHDDLVPGPKRITLSVPSRYTARVRVAFTGTSTETVTVNARVVKPDGTLHGKPYQRTVAGNQDSRHARCTIVAVTRLES